MNTSGVEVRMPQAFRLMYAPEQNEYRHVFTNSFPFCDNASKKGKIHDIFVSQRLFKITWKSHKVFCC